MALEPPRTRFVSAPSISRVRGMRQLRPLVVGVTAGVLRERRAFVHPGVATVDPSSGMLAFVVAGCERPAGDDPVPEALVFPRMARFVFRVSCLVFVSPGGGLIGKELPPARGFLLERPEAPGDRLADGRVALGDDDEDVQVR